PGGDQLPCSRALTAGRQSHFGRRFGLAGSLSEEGDLAARIMDGYGTIRGQVGSSVDAQLSRSCQPPTGEPPVAGAAVSVHFSLLSRARCHQQRRRACLATTGGSAQELGWKSNRQRSSRAGCAQQHPGQRTPAGEESARGTDRITGE